MPAISELSSRIPAIPEPRSKIISPPPSGKEVPQINAVAFEGQATGVLPSPDISTEKGPAAVEYSMFGHQITATLANHIAQVPTKEHQLGVNVDIKV